jgi:CRISPR-associated protein Cmr3
MTTWIIEPRDPMIVRDGRPFGPDQGTRAETLPFPFPSTIAGGVRTRSGLKYGVFDDSASNIAAVKSVRIRGPLLVELDQEGGGISSWMVPAPADAYLLPVKDDHTQVDLHRLFPLQIPQDTQTNLPEAIAIVGLPDPDLQKPLFNAPRFWYWSQFEQWLEKPPSSQHLNVEAIGHQGPLADRRMHVRIDQESLTGVEGFLFMTSGLEFARQKNKKASIPVTPLGLALETDATMNEGVIPLGGERRLTSWRQDDTVWPQLPAGLTEEIVKTKACRLVLLTPGYFSAGYYPQWMGKTTNNVTPTLKAVALAQPQIVSGWDLERHAPKPTRRLAPAGTVYFLKLEGEDEAIRRWVGDMWMQCVSDNEAGKLALAGFGLAVLGEWSGEVRPMKENK